MRLSILFLLLATGLAAAPEYPGMGPDIYDVHADGAADVSAALARARTEHKRVLLDFGANWCIWCRRLHRVFDGDPGVAARLRQSFIVVMVDVNRRHGTDRNAALVARYGNPVRKGIPGLVVLGDDGRRLVTHDNDDFEQGAGYSPGRILAFLNRWAPPAAH